MAGESSAHLELKRLALDWSLAQGYRIQALEVSIPMLRARLDVAAARISRSHSPGTVAFFECKQSRSDLRNDTKLECAIRARLTKLAERRALYEEWLQVKTPHLRNGDTLFPEYDTWDFSGTDWEPYRSCLLEIQRLTSRLKQNIKFDRVSRAGYANLHYVVATEEIADCSEIPPEWGVLERRTDALELIRRPVWRELSMGRRNIVIERIAAAASRSVRTAGSDVAE